MKIALALSTIALVSTIGIDAAAKDEGSSKDEVIQCRFQKMTGSRTKAYRICMTKRDWDRYIADEQEALYWFRNKPQSGPGGAF